MITGIQGKPSRNFRVRFTEKIYRLHFGGIMSHAPRNGGVYELVEFLPGADDGKVVYVGHVPQAASIAEHLQAIVEGRGGLPADKLQAVKDRIAHLYFDAVVEADCAVEDDWKDLAWALVRTKEPDLNDFDGQPHSGRYSDISLEVQS